MTVDTKEVVTTISYLIGVRKDILELNFAECKETLVKLYADRDATAIRYLCKLRTVLMQKLTALCWSRKNTPVQKKDCTASMKTSCRLRDRMK